MAQLSSTAPSSQTLAAAGDVPPGPPSGRSHSQGAFTSAVLTTNRSSQPPTSLTSREWIVPPRPKPGRKPATGAPPTKRKAQNRAAQRAFRERRAARVGELEEEIKKIEQEDDEEQAALRSHIEKVEKEIEEYRSSLTFWMQRCRGLEAELAIESAAKQEALRSSKEASTAPPLPPTSQDPSEEELVRNNPEPVGCGNCSSISNCQCIQEVINMQELGSATDGIEMSSNKRSHPPAHGCSQAKRIKPEPVDQLEMDFTTTASFPPQQPSTASSAPLILASSSSAVADPCGFCTDTSTCICAEMQAAAANEGDTTAERRFRHDLDQDSVSSQQATQEDITAFPCSPLRPHISQHSHITPPPSDPDTPIAISSTPHAFSSFQNPCVNGPGTCFQCRSDPESTLFCKSLAKSSEQRRQRQPTSLPSQKDGCCRQTGIRNGSCREVALQDRSGTAERSAPTTETTPSKTDTTIPSYANNGCDVRPNKQKGERDSSPPPILLTCADAYTTLSRHPAYERATREMSKWLPQLQPAPSRDCNAQSEQQDTAHEHGRSADSITSTNVEGRPAMEIDAANVMAVLREFDRRFNDQ